MGKGMAAALLTAAVRSTLRAAADGRTVAETVDVAARSLADDLDRTESFVTLFHAELDPVRRLIRYVDAGHGHAIMIGADGRGELLSSSGMPVGIDEAPYEEHEVELRPGDTLVVYSDGLDDPRWERPDAPNVLALAAHGATSAAEIVDRLTAARADQAEASDDITLLVVRYQPDAEPTPQTNEYGGS
jgi:serine phosphatase RsbU (regulator of sigma subunit)